MPTYSVAVRAGAGFAPCARQFQRLLAQLEAALVTADDAAAAADFHLEFDRDGAALRCAALPGYAPHRVRLSRGRPARAADPLRKAVGGAATVIDATAGWGADAARLAGWGCRVTAVEKHPAVAALLQHAHARCRDAGLRTRLRIVHADSVEYLRAAAAADAPEVVYLDPMYPPPSNAAAAKKPLTMLRLLAGPPGDHRALLEAALACARRRVVVKRPPRAPPLSANRAGEITAKLVRFDLYQPRAGA